MSNLPGFVILLTREQDRVLNVTNNIMPFYPELDIITAIDGRTEELDQILAQGNYALDKHYIEEVEKGKIACTLSHLKALQEIVDQQLEMAIVLEDDMVLNSEFSSTVQKIAQQVKRQNLEYIYLYVHPRFRIESQALLEPYYYSWGRCAYLVSLAGAKKLVQQFQTIRQNGDFEISQMIADGLLQTRMCGSVICHNIGQLEQVYAGEQIKSCIWESPFFKQTDK